MSPQPAVSVVMCTNVYDRFFEQALASIESQSFRHFELLVVANGIGDEAFGRLQRRVVDPRSRLIRTQTCGVAFSRNLGLHHCRAPLVAVMDADDVSHKDRLSKQHALMLSRPNVVVCGTAYEIIDAEGNVQSTRVLPEGDRQIRRQLPWRNPLCHPSTMYRAEMARRVGGYGGNGAEDYKLWLRFAGTDGAEFHNLQEPLVGYRVPVVSQARRTRVAYAHVAGIQFERFVATGSMRWLAAAGVTMVKQAIRGREPARATRARS